MSWALIDDQSTFHAKVVAAGNAGWGACVRMITWSMSHLTDGRIPTHVAKLIANDEELAALERAGLIVVHENDVAIHDFLQWNKSARQIRKERLARAKAGKNGGLASGRKRQQTPSKREASASASAQALATDFGSTFPNPSSSPLPSSSDPRERDARVGARESLAPDLVSAKPLSVPDEFRTQFGAIADGIRMVGGRPTATNDDLWADFQDHAARGFLRSSAFDAEARVFLKNRAKFEATDAGRGARSSPLQRVDAPAPALRTATENNAFWAEQQAKDIAARESAERRKAAGK